ncbi:hypothetical protein COB52_06110 [Candidatus Kaiserbacteria bacterium]|nr:MAG: hypothetical protein COB52_06110 [Candidatus Kaiserbacteria bacterium]
MTQRKLSEDPSELFSIIREIKSLGAVLSVAGSFQIDATDLIGIGLILTRASDRLQSIYDAVDAEVDMTKRLTPNKVPQPVANEKK